MGLHRPLKSVCGGAGGKDGRLELPEYVHEEAAEVDQEAAAVIELRLDRLLAMGIGFVLVASTSGEESDSLETGTSDVEKEEVLVLPSRPRDPAADTPTELDRLA